MHTERQGTLPLTTAQHRLGVAPSPLDRRRFTGDDLAHALRTTQQPAMQMAAAALGQAIRAEDSVARTIDQLRRWQLLPSPTAA